MKRFRRIELRGRINEASAMLRVSSPTLLHLLGTEQAFWIAHDEAGLKTMMSLVHPTAGEDDEDGWEISTVRLSTAEKGARLTDAEAVAYAQGQVFVFGSGFVGPGGVPDRRRSFVARFSEDSVTREGKAGGLTAVASVLDLGTTVTASVHNGVQAQNIQLLKPNKKARRRLKRSTDGSGTDLVNIEGAAFAGDSLALGLRWPVSKHGQPLVAIIEGAAPVLCADDWSVAALADCPVSILVLDTDASKNRPAGIRAMSAPEPPSSRTVHAVTGSTDRDMAAGDPGAASSLHIEVNLDSGKTNQVQTFDGQRKVEALAPGPPGGWIYAVDDEDAIVLLSAGTDAQ